MANKNNLQKEITGWDRRLQLLKEKKAKLGYSADPGIDIEIEEIEAKIAELGANLGEFGDIDYPPSSTDEPSLRVRQYKIARYWAADDRKANLSRIDLSNTDLRAVDLIGANLSLANLSGADLRMANLSKADLRLANLSQANLQEAKLVGGVDLTEANLVGANLMKANLLGANLTKANLVGASLIEANLSMAILKEIIYDHTTIWPDNLKLQRLIPGILIGCTAGAMLGVIVGIFFEVIFGLLTISKILIVLGECLLEWSLGLL
jgi:uncharacterized protein YjbI with pentapeptide repeats